MDRKDKDLLSEIAEKMDVAVLKNIQKQLRLPGMSNWILTNYGELLSFLMDDEGAFIEPEKLTGNEDKLEEIKERLSLIVMGCIGVAKTLKIDLHNPIVKVLKGIEEGY